jgi:hypothetical protein
MFKFMNVAYSPIESEFETSQAAAAYESWLRSKVGDALVQANNPNTPRYSTDEVRQRVMALIERRIAGTQSAT